MRIISSNSSRSFEMQLPCFSIPPPAHRRRGCGASASGLAGQPFEITLSSGGAAKASRGDRHLERGGQYRRDHVEHGLDHEDRERGRSIQENCLRQRPAARWSADQQHGRAKGKVTALRLPHSIQGIALSVNSKAHSDRGRTLLKTHRTFRALAMDTWRAASAAA